MISPIPPFVVSVLSQRPTRPATDFDTWPPAELSVVARVPVAATLPPRGVRSTPQEARRRATRTHVRGSRLSRGLQTPAADVSIGSITVPGQLPPLAAMQ